MIENNSHIYCLFIHYCAWLRQRARPIKYSGHLDIIFHSEHYFDQIVMKQSAGMGCPLAASYEILANSA